VTRFATAANIPPMAWPDMVAWMYLGGKMLAKPNIDVPRIELPTEK